MTLFKNLRTRIVLNAGGNPPVESQLGVFTRAYNRISSLQPYKPLHNLKLHATDLQLRYHLPLIPLRVLQIVTQLSDMTATLSLFLVILVVFRLEILVVLDLA